MAVLRTVLTIILILVSIVFTAIVLMQEGKSAGLGAISGAVKEIHSIDKDKCVKCGVCMETCKFGAIVKK